MKIEIDDLTFTGFPDHSQIRIDTGEDDWDDTYFLVGSQIERLRDFLNKVLDKMPGYDTIDT